MLINSATLTYVPAGSSSNTSSYSPRSSSRYSSGSACGRLPKILSIKLFCAIWNSHLQSTLNLLRNGHLIVFVLCSSYIEAARSTVIIDVIIASFLNEGIAMFFLSFVNNNNKISWCYAFVGNDDARTHYIRSVTYEPHSAHIHGYKVPLWVELNLSLI